MESQGEEQTLLAEGLSRTPGAAPASGQRKRAAVAVTLLAALALVAAEYHGRQGLVSTAASARGALRTQRLYQWVTTDKSPVPSVSNVTLNTSAVQADGIRWGPVVFGARGGVGYEETRGTPHASTTLFCFTVATASSKRSTSEVDLVRHQFAHRSGIFQCDATRVYGDRPLSLQPGNESAPHIIEHHMAPSKMSEYGQGFFVNRDIFIKVLDMVVKEAAFLKFDVVVKADPDAVLLAPRLRSMLATRRPAEELWYYANCNASEVGYVTMQGPLEVFSRGLVERFGNDPNRDSDCEMTPAEKAMAGEDMFLDRCMHWVGGHRLMDLNLMADTFCVEYDSCSALKAAAYHGFKDVDSWEECLQSALGSE